MAVKYAKWDGSRWVSYAPTFKKWDGNMWTYVFPKRWNGTSWYDPVIIPTTPTYTPPKTVTKTWTATWSGSYQGNNSLRDSGTQGYMYQGKYGQYDPTANITHNPVYWGRQRSLFGFDFSDIQAQLANTTIKSVQVYLHIKHSWFFNGATASLCTHNFTSKPQTFNSINYNIASHKFNSRDEGAWITVPTQYGIDLAQGKITGFGIFRDSDDQMYYGYWHGALNPNPPKLKITYETKSSGGYTNTVTKPNTTVTTPAKYFAVPEGWGLDAVTRELIRRGDLPSDFATAKQKLMELNNFHTSSPLLLIGQKIMYKPATTN